MNTMSTRIFDKLLRSFGGVELKISPIQQCGTIHNKTYASDIVFTKTEGIELVVVSVAEIKMIINASKKTMFHELCAYLDHMFKQNLLAEGT